MMKKILYIFCVWTMCSLHSWGQITEAEYFFDTDPGVGSATSLTITSGNTIEETFSMPVAGLTDGVHVLHIRVKEGSSWSLYYRDYFYVLSDEASSTPDAKPIVAAEYFFDADPGVGSATSLSITPGNTIDETFSIPIAGLTDGVHVLQIRIKDDDDNWSLYYRDYFYVLSDKAATPDAKPIVAAEYFFDTDPGVGNATDIGVTQGFNIDEDLVIQVPLAMADGDHYLYIRVQDQEGTWSLYKRALFTVDSALSVEEFNSDSFEIFPNPTKNNIHINFKQYGNYSFSVYNTSGKEIFKQDTLGLNNRFNLSKYASGIYILKIKDKTNNTFQNVKIVKM